MTIDTAFESSLGHRYSFVKYKSSFEAVFGRDASLAKGFAGWAFAAEEFGWPFGREMNRRHSSRFSEDGLITVAARREIQSDYWSLTHLSPSMDQLGWYLAGRCGAAAC